MPDRSPTPLPSAGAITDVAGIEVGHFTDPRRPTGCTVVIAREGAVGGVDVRGAAPGTRETDLLAPGNLVQQVHAVLLAGGSAWGLAAADGVMRWLEERGVGLDVRYGHLADRAGRRAVRPAPGRCAHPPRRGCRLRGLRRRLARGAGRGQRRRRRRRAGRQAVRHRARDEGRRRQRLGHGRRRDGRRAGRLQRAGRRAWTRTPGSVVAGARTRRRPGVAGHAPRPAGRRPAAAACWPAPTPRWA